MIETVASPTATTVRLSLTRAACLALTAVAFVHGAQAQVTTERGASILIYPKVVASSSGDSVLQLANLSRNVVHGFCAYVDGTSWQATDFLISLEPMQPVHWVASRGRMAGETDTNDIPAAPADFLGELLCVQTDASGAPLSGNQLVGHATVADLGSGDTVAYAAVGLNGLGINDGDDVLCIGGDPSDSCLLGGEYDPCPVEWNLEHAAEGAADPQLGAAAQRGTRVTVAPCSQNVRDREPATVEVDLTVTNEFEERFTGGVSVTCWADLSLADVAGGLFDRTSVGSDIVQTHLSPAASSGAFVLVAQHERRAAPPGPIVSRSATNGHHLGAALQQDLIVLPMGIR
jgi:hypothetical protein